MKPFTYIKATSVEDACTALAGAGDNARVMAGGTDLLIELRRPEGRSIDTLLDISWVSPLRGATMKGDCIRLGPLTTHAELTAAPLVHEYLPILSEAASWIGSPQIRNRGTLGGNIMNAAACADTVPPLVALGASVILSSVSHSREIPLASLFLRPYVTCATRQEILTAIMVPIPVPDFAGSFLKLGRRNALAIARLSVAAMVRRSADGRIEDARIVPGAALPTWRRITKAEEVLKGERPTVRLFSEAGRVVAEEMIGATGRRWSSEYKEPVIAALVRRALQRCVGGDEYEPV